MTHHDLEILEKKAGAKSKVSLGGDYSCDRPECDHFSTNDYSKFSARVLRHTVKTGSATCKECGDVVDFKFSKNKPTVADVNDKLAFHDKCEKKFYERKGFKKND